MRDTRAVRPLVRRRDGGIPPLYQLFAATFLIVSGCGESQPSTSGRFAAQATPARQAVPVIMTDDIDVLESTAYTVATGHIDGTTLEMTVRVAGGCDTHGYQLHVSRHFAESFPVQTRAFLVHDSDDPCEALLTERLSFDLEPLLEEYRRSYGGRLDPIIIRLDVTENRQGEQLELRYEP